ncbi:MAG: DNA polymerase IV, partial [Candidatus Omnitrophica bacterium]|nr:DNA polymerase IV [Candidatus Omnitrophota bacterium]
ICPGLICLPSDYETYSLYSRRLFGIIRRFTPIVDEYSIDEAFAELSGLRRIYRTDYVQIAWQIKQSLQKELGLTVSVGLSASKTLAKIASKEKKPDGFTVVRANELQHYLPGIPLERVCGFGPNTVALLQKKGIRTVWDYVGRPEGWAKQWLGKIGVELWHELRGEPVYPVLTQEKDDYATISKTKTFTPPSSDKDFVKAQLVRNVESAFIKLRRHRLRVKRIAIFLRDQEFRSCGLEAELDRSSSSIMEAVPLVSALFEKVFCPAKFYRLTGVVLSKLEPDVAMQYSLFDDVPQIRSFRAVDKVIDGVNEIYGKHSLHLGVSLWLGKHRQHLSERGDLPARKAELLRGETFRQRLNIPMWQVKV